MYKYCCDRCKNNVNQCDKCENWFELRDIFSFNITSYEIDPFILSVNSADGKSYKQHVESFKLCSECWRNTEKKSGTFSISLNDLGK